ncbi:HpcH/HpaI aldolase/citrate lyase family protein [Streptomyces hirsutus]|uniref:HpcH/HpaI aldolase/citrate lyase family protein n=1 Tax=Streptomyces hirsutus TaxID=35620 RepID=UPI0036A3A6F3
MTVSRLVPGRAEHIGPARRRSCLSVPGGDERKLAKAWQAEADEIVLDLEDAVPEAGKEAARAAVGAALGHPDRPRGAPQVAVRVNAPRTPWCHLDIQACAAAGELPLSLVVPKVENPGDLEFVDRLLDGAEAAAGRRAPITVQALIETAAGLANLREITAASPRLTALILGYADLGASLGRGAQAPPDSWLWTQDTLLVAARTAGLAAIDGPFLGVADDEEFGDRVRRARDLGFDGKWVIHPRQLKTVNTVFTPSAPEIDHARAVLDALDEAAGRGAGATALNGQMLDEAVAVAARRVLARAPGTTGAPEAPTGPSASGAEGGSGR